MDHLNPIQVRYLAALRPEVQSFQIYPILPHYRTFGKLLG